MKFWNAVLFFPLVLGVKKVCPEEKGICSDTATCCELLDKTYGCCPLENAVCCDDHIHCCPSNTRCATGMCVQGTNMSTGMHLLQNKDVICPDGAYSCPEDTTCCKNPSSEYSCCPMQDAVCCSDGNHCCPFGTTCDLEEEKCVGDGFQTEMYDSRKKILSPLTSGSEFSLVHPGSNVSSVICPESEYQCPDGYTCCKQQSGDYGCCPFPKASCCLDGLHCCPEHMHCDPSSQYCSQELRNITSVHNKPAKRIAEVKICPDKTACSSEQTCCLVSETQFGCCHYANATCCKDFLHCCPSGTICDLKQKRCVRELNLTLNVI